MPYYMYVYGVEKDAIKNKNTHYLALKTAFSNIKLTEQFYMGFNLELFNGEKAPSAALTFINTEIKSKFHIKYSRLLS